MGSKETHFKVIKEYKTSHPDSILFEKGETVTVHKEFTDDPDWRNWLWCEGQCQNRAWVPEQYLSRTSGKATLLRDYDAKELSVSPGEILVVMEILNGFGLSRKSDGSRGWVPLKVLERV
jgi:hypothetical protein